MSMQAGDVLAGRYRLDDLLAEAGAGRFWRAHDLVLHRPVAVHIIAEDDARAGPLLEAARRTGPVIDRRLLRVLDAEAADGRCFVVNEWGQGDSLDILLTREGPIAPRRAAWLVAEVADSLVGAHEAGLAHGCLSPEHVLIDQHGQVRIIGFGVEAALRGLPAGRTNVDEIDLAGLLYCALTGKWPGISPSDVPPAPEVHGEVLRPRRVRAGIPRVLDALCDEVLNPQRESDRPHPSARSIRDLLLDHVGELTGTHVAVPAARPLLPPTPPPSPSLSSPAPTSPAAPTAVVPVVPAADLEPGPDDPPTGPPEDPPAAGPADETTAGDRPAGPEPEVTTAISADESPPSDAPPRASTDLPTQAGMPVFHDDDEVDWLRARTERPAPPPPLADPTPKPLFAPDPPEGEPVRRPRPGSRAASNPDYWPWDSSQDSARDPGRDSGVRPVGRDTGSWASGSWSEDRWDTGDGFDDTGDQVPGRSWIRLALIVGICLLVGVAVVSAYQLGLKPPTPGSSEEPTTTTTPSVAPPTPFTDLVADDFDPQGTDGQQENPDSVPNVLDGDPATSWTTSTYEQNFGPAGLKTGVGLVIDLGGTKAVRRVLVTTEGGQTSLAAYVTSEPPQGVSELTPVGTASGDGELSIDLAEPVSGQYVTVWLTLLPQLADGFRGTITEVQVLGS
ncbi:protein kinase family protein [Nocardioides pinisoli]|uniref:Protein kinase family protein n=1 Tax=Nocardioides pinisoli TaxID=2950279 RepID=A0ABT1KRK9_9ACTN|nr:protein kinase family protein [Nocardioides pinisoli]MCP3420380.1 protein kinase family protein [Nocardioides pinisoli]